MCFAELLLTKGCNVVFADLALRPEAEQLVSQYRSKDKAPRAVFVQTDVTSWSALRNMFEVTVREFGSFDLVCPGAGVYEPNWSNFWHPPGSAESKDELDASHYALLDINLTHPIRTTQLALSYWLHPPAPTSQASLKASSENPKRVVHVSSIAAQLPVFRAPLYGASKFAISGFVRCLASLESAGVRVNAVAPGVVRTPLWTEHPEKMIYLKEEDAWVTPQEVAEAMLSCAESEEHKGGTILEVGAGNTRHVGAFNDPGPDLSPGKGFATSNSAQANEVIWEWMGDIKIWAPPAADKS